jgi:hypothetical protein
MAPTASPPLPADNHRTLECEFDVADKEPVDRALKEADRRSEEVTTQPAMHG